MSNGGDLPRRRRRWRDFRTRAGGTPVRDFLLALSDPDRASVLAAMSDVRVEGLEAARHVRSDVYEVRADGDRVTYHVLFAQEGRRGQVLLALHGFAKKTRKTPPALIELALARLRDWRARGASRRRER
jgi:phage-related protein